jgi:transposase
MKAYALDLREKVVKFINSGGSKAEAARRFELGRSTVYLNNGSRFNSVRGAPLFLSSKQGDKSDTAFDTMLSF